MPDIDLYFDFLSPYAYFASLRIDALAERNGRQVVWRPFRLGVAIVKAMGLPPNLETPLKGPYIRRDVARLSQVFGAPLGPSQPPPLPFAPAQLFYGAPPAVRPDLAKALLRAHWREGRNINDPQTLVGIASTFGVEEREALAALSSTETRQALSDQTRAALARGVFGSPTFVVGEELFWGVDRMWLLEHYLLSGETYAPLDGTPPIEALGHPV